MAPLTTSINPTTPPVAQRPPGPSSDRRELWKGSRSRLSRRLACRRAGRNIRPHHDALKPRRRFIKAANRHGRFPSGSRPRAGDGRTARIEPEPYPPFYRADQISNQRRRSWSYILAPQRCAPAALVVFFPGERVDVEPATTMPFARSMPVGTIRPIRPDEPGKKGHDRSARSAWPPMFTPSGRDQAYACAGACSSGEKPGMVRSECSGRRSGRWSTPITQNIVHRQKPARQSRARPQARGAPGVRDEPKEN